MGPLTPLLLTSLIFGAIHLTRARPCAVTIENGTELEVEISVLRRDSELYAGTLAPGAATKLSVKFVYESDLTVNAVVNGKHLSLTHCYTTRLGGACRFVIDPEQVRFEHVE